MSQSHILSKQGYEVNVCLAYEGEIIGERLYRALSAQYAESDRTRKLLAVSRVEGMTHRRLQSVVARLGIEPVEAVIHSAVQRRLAELKQLSWETLIAKAVAEWPAHLDRFELLRRSAIPADAMAVQSLVDHECALIQFALLEQEQPGSEHSLQPLLIYLGEKSGNDNAQP